MKRRPWLLPAVAGAVLCLCCCAAVSGSVAFVLFRTAGYARQAPGPDADPGPAPRIVRQPPGQDSHEAVAAAAAATIPERDLIDLAQRLGGLPASALEPGPRLPSPELGESRAFWVHDEESRTYSRATARLSFATPHAFWWIQEGYDVDPQDLERSALRFEEGIYPTNRRLFGSEPNPGIDGDPHLYVFLGRAPGVGGYFAGPDGVPAGVSPHSNEHEMFYVNLEDARPGNDYFDGLLAHEFEHMIHWATDRNEELWVNEGLAELAAHVNGLDAGSLQDAFSRSPETQLNAWPETDESAPHYGAAYLFMAYVLDRFGEQAIQRLAAERANGTAGVEAALRAGGGAAPRFDELFADWTVANYLDDPGAANGRYNYGELEVARPRHSARHDAYPVYREATVHQYAADYLLLTGAAGLTVEFTGSLAVSLVGNTPHGGRFQWWSNRGDDGDATLTREFDLTGLDHATLQFWTWYHLETDYDYAFVEVSPDQGRTWLLLASEHSTLSNPNGASYGPALTGRSGGGASPAWVQQHFDLSPFAGQRVLVRLEVVTDDSVLYPGFCIDDVSIPELGFSDGAEEGENGWDSQGWVRTTGDVPQEFQVQVILLGRHPTVQRLLLDEQGQGSLTLPDTASADRSVLVVSGITPVTTEWASYAYRLSRP